MCGSWWTSTVTLGLTLHFVLSVSLIQEHQPGAFVASVCFLKYPLNDFHSRFGFAIWLCMRWWRGHVLEFPHWRKGGEPTVRPLSVMITSVTPCWLNCGFRNGCGSTTIQFSNCSKMRIIVSKHYLVSWVQDKEVWWNSAPWLAEDLMWLHRLFAVVVLELCIDLAFFYCFLNAFPRWGPEHHIFDSWHSYFDFLVTWVSCHYGVSTPLWNSNTPACLMALPLYDLAILPE